MKKILIVDDQPEVRELVEVTLKLGDFAILQAENGVQAIEIAKKEKLDLIIMDVMMPEMDGLRATKILKADPDTKSFPIILLTAKGQKDDLDKGFAAGADDYFVKPFSPLDLIRKVEKVLENS